MLFCNRVCEYARLPKEAAGAPAPGFLAGTLYPDVIPWNLEKHRILNLDSSLLKHAVSEPSVQRLSGPKTSLLKTVWP